MQLTEIKKETCAGRPVDGFLFRSILTDGQLGLWSA